MNASADLAHQLAAIEDLGLEGLRLIWRERYGAPPSLRSADLLRRLLAWKIQVEVHGDLDAQTRRRRRAGAPMPPADRLAAGTCLAREWKGVTYQVEARDGAYVFEGQRYASLSKIARAITGSRWNGPRFFGLREAEAPS